MVDAFNKDVLAEQWFSFMHTLLERLQRTFRAQGVSQKDIADRLGKDPGFISRCLSGRQNMTVRTIHDIARAMGCRLDVQFTPLNTIPRANNQPHSSTAYPEKKKSPPPPTRWLDTPKSAAA